MPFLTEVTGLPLNSTPRLELRGAQSSECGAPAGCRLDRHCAPAGLAESSGDPDWTAVASRHCAPLRIPIANLQAANRRGWRAAAASHRAPPARGERHGWQPQSPASSRHCLPQSAQARSAPDEPTLISARRSAGAADRGRPHHDAEERGAALRWTAVHD